ncbi:hypothetical protein CYY_005231 [Polysphondylium violaceum]|uniref:AIG1-type G domain-containing protein n=1 Tax=Polysphondylium violaceum TaxID=133409 RepID=A0A8J4PU33_9MYCE|nr:hypothetical protein CYY_005231 [Polysphondylium violaceum]
MCERTILIIGKTGSGKSTIANVITSTNEFKEGEYGVSETKNFKCLNFIHNGVNYKVIDSVGLGDTKLSERQVLDQMAQACSAVTNGISQILYVFKGKLSQDEIDAFNLIKKVLFGQLNINAFITVIRTSFPKYRDPTSCQMDIDLMINESIQASQIIGGCNKLIHVNNMTVDEQPGLENRLDTNTRLLIHLMGCTLILNTTHSTMINNVNKYFYDKEQEIKRQQEREEQLRIAQIQREEYEAQILVQKKLKGYDYWNKTILIQPIALNSCFLDNQFLVFTPYGSKYQHIPSIAHIQFQMIPVDDGHKVAFKSLLNSMYLSATMGSLKFRDHISETEKFILIKQNDMWVILTHFGTYLSARPQMPLHPDNELIVLITAKCEMPEHFLFVSC